jgi:hypothetical protein
MPRRTNGSKWASYVVLRDTDKGPVVVGTVVSRPADVKRDVPRLFGPSTRWVSFSRAPAELLRRARLADRGGLPVSAVVIGKDGATNF